MNIAVINYGAGNICSVVNALRRVGADPLLTDDPEKIMAADRVVLPGQGEAGHTMASLRQKGLADLVRSLRQPVLGICIGQQLFCEYSEEGETTCLGLFPGVRARRFSSLWPDTPQKIPHIGWNSLTFPQKGRLFAGLSEETYVYFVHSYYLKAEEDIVTARTEYGVTIDASVEKGNLFACQFHPEKSSGAGLRILQNFVALVREGV